MTSEVLSKKNGCDGMLNKTDGKKNVKTEVEQKPDEMMIDESRSKVFFDALLSN